MALKYDLLLKGGEVIDPSQTIRGVRDVAFQGGTVAAVMPDIPGDEANEVIDVTGKPESTEGRPWGQSLKKPSGAPLNLG